MTMSPRLRRLALTAHIATSIGWLGSVAAFLALALTGLDSDDEQLAQASYIAMDVIARVVIAPLALASLLSGVIQGIGTPWGLFRHYWVVIKLLITIGATIVLLQQLGPISNLAVAASQSELTSDARRTERMSLALHAGGGLLVLLVPTVLSVYKPRGLTRYGRARNRGQGRTPAAG